MLLLKEVNIMACQLSVQNKKLLFLLNWIPIHKGASRSEGPLSSRLAKMMIDYIEEVKFCLLQANECLLALVQVKPEVVIWLPRIIVLHNFLSSEECEYLKAIARPRLQVSTVVDIKTGKDKLWSNGDWHRVSKGRLQSRYLRTNFILDLYNTRADLRKKDHLAIDKYPLHGLRSLAVARQTVPEKTKKKKKALVIHGNSLVGCLCLILHDMIVHTPLEELQTSVSTSVITVQVLCIGRGGKASKPDKRNGLLPLGGQGKCHERVSPKFTSTARLSPLLFNLRRDQEESHTLAVERNKKTSWWTLKEIVMLYMKSIFMKYDNNRRGVLWIWDFGRVHRK
ncbi:hypothetical protein YC2023_024466 [Brassica napus]